MVTLELTDAQIEIITNCLEDANYMLSMDRDSCNHLSSGTPEFYSDLDMQIYRNSFKDLRKEIYSKIILASK